MTVFDEASGEHSLLDSMRLLADQYRQARPGFVAKEHAAYPASYEKARAGQVPRLPGRIVLDLAGLPAAANLTGISRVQLELARGFAALAAQGLMEFAVTAFDGDDFRPAQLTDTASAAKPWGTQVADGSFAFRPGDQLLLVEMRPTFLEGILPRLVAARRAGAMITLINHDIIPMLDAAWADERFGTGFLASLSQFLRVVNRVVCVSRTVSRDLACLLSLTSMRGLSDVRPLPIAWTNLGCDVLSRCPDVTPSFPVDQDTLVAVGSFSSRKALFPLLQAMEQLWAKGHGTRLVLIGADIGAGVTRSIMRQHPEFNRRLFLPGYASDEEVAAAYRRANALVFPSLAEGFGMPLVEAACLGCPVIARDLEVFRETSGGDAFFFPDGGPEVIAESLERWLALPRREQLAHVPRRSLVTWQQSANVLRAILFSTAHSIQAEVGTKAAMNLPVLPR